MSPSKGALRRLSGARVAVLVASLGLASAPAAGPLLQEQGRQGEGLPHRIAVEGGRAFIALDSGLLVVDSGRSGLEQQWHVALPDSALDVATSGGLVAVAADEAGTVLLDANGPGAPRIVTTLSGAAALAVALQGDLLAVALAPEPGNHASAVRIFQLTDPSAPTEVGQALLPGRARCLAFVGQSVLAGFGSAPEEPAGGIAVIGLSATGVPSGVASSFTPLGVNSIAVNGDVAWLATGDALQGSLVLVRLAGTGPPVALGRTLFADALQDVRWTPSGLQVAARSLGVLAIDIRSPSSPQAVSRSSSEWQAWCVADFGGRTLMGGRSSFGTGGLELLDLVLGVPDPAVPERIEMAEATGVATEDGIAVLAWRDRLEVRSAGAPPSVAPLSYWTVAGADFSHVALGGGLVAVADGSRVRLLDRLGDGTLREYGAACIGSGRAVAAAISDGLLAVATGDALELFDAQASGDSQPLASFTDGDWIADVAVDGDVAIVAAGSDLLVLDLTAVSSPRLAARLALGDRLLSVALDGDVVVATGTLRAAHVVSIEDPTRPRLVGTAGAGPAFDVTVSDGLALVARGARGVLALRVSTSTVPSAVAEAALPGIAVAVARRDRDVHVAASEGQQFILTCDACESIGGCSAVASIAPAQVTTCPGEAVILDATASTVLPCDGLVTWAWSLDGTLMPQLTQPFFVVPVDLPSGAHRVQLVVGCDVDATCDATAEALIQVRQTVTTRVHPASLRVSRGADTVEVSWELLSGPGRVALHASLDPAGLPLPDPPVETQVAVGQGTQVLVALESWQGTLTFYRVKGLPTCLP